MKRKQKTNIRVIVKTVPHPDPQHAIDTMAKIVLKELNRRESDKPLILEDSPGG